MTPPPKPPRRSSWERAAPRAAQGGGRGFLHSLATSGSIHATALVSLALLPGAAATILAEGPDREARRVVIPPSIESLRLLPPPEAEPLEVREPEVSEPLDEARLAEHPPVGQAEPPADPALRDGLAETTWVLAELDWEVRERQSEPEPPAPPTVAELVPEVIPEVAPAPPAPARESRPREDNAKPRYPRLSQRAGEEGTVLCRLHIDADGDVTRVEVVESSGFSRLDDAAVEALATWRFQPRTVAGRAVPDTVLHPVTFVLRDR